MQLHERLIAEFTQEVAATKRVLERVPEAHLDWKPHQKSMSLGQLAMHVANVPGGVATLASHLVAEVPVVPLSQATSQAELFATLEWSTATAIGFLREWGDEGLEAEWRMTMNGATLLQMPRYQMIRSIMLNHWYHHRGELIVYLRLLDVPVPGIYGPSADENPFAG